MQEKQLYLTFKTNKGVQYFKPDQIIRLEAISNYTRIYFTNHQPVLMAKVLRKYQDILLPFGFIRTHRSNLINSHFILSANNNGTITMKDNSLPEISRRKKSAVINAIKESLKQMEIDC